MFKPFNQRSLKFKLANDVTEHEANNATYVVYAHRAKTGLYVGVTKDVILRWRGHTQTAFKEDHKDYSRPFALAIRKNQFDHIILGTAKTLEIAEDMEAAAIDFYNPNYNARAQLRKFNTNYGFKLLDSQIMLSTIIKQPSRAGSDYSRCDRDRITITAEVYGTNSRKRLRPAVGEIFDSSLSIECSRSERDKLAIGDLVKIKVALTTKTNGSKHLVAAKTAALTKIN
ncbi:MAG: hypothetical protein ACI88H_002007 [Cocleimonas sp.]|jgi:hypothetical protein